MHAEAIEKAPLAIKSHVTHYVCWHLDGPVRQMGIGLGEFLARELLDAPPEYELQLDEPVHDFAIDVIPRPTECHAERRADREHLVLKLKAGIAREVQEYRHKKSRAKAGEPAPRRVYAILPVYDLRSLMLAAVDAGKLQPGNYVIR